MDKVDIKVIAGIGGDGIASFRHEKYVPLGGPDGGDGGNGGSVYVRADKSLNNLISLRHRKLLKAGNGGKGGSQKKHGKNGDDLFITVPPGTLVYKVEDGGNSVVEDLDRHNQQVMVAKGGRGGLGNVHFATSTNQAPKKFTNGEKGEEAQLILDLKLIADAGIIGLPNAGKSTLLSSISAASPKVAGYPFTTMEPELGEVHVGKSIFVVAEIPGLIKGAHQGKGLGHSFLRHAERTKLLIHLLDGSSPTIIDDLGDIEHELAMYQLELAQKRRILAVNKIDLPEVQARLPELQELFGSLGQKPFFISGASGQGVADLLSAVAAELATITGPVLMAEAPVKIFRPKPKR